jgi:hypothetical protein
MDRRFAFLFTLLYLIVIATSTAFAVPKLISYQGVLNDKDGVPISTTVEMGFTIYDSSAVGNALWNETQNVQVSNGLFDVKLGSVQQLNTAVLFSDAIYLGIRVGADPEMTPRQRITAGTYVHTVIVPIGSIMAWTKNIPGVPVLADGWVECNGQTISDAQSPLNGQTLPDLNGQNRFLRGNTVSGGVGGAPFHQHYSGLHRSRVHSDMLFIGGYGKTNTTADLSDYLDGIRNDGTVSYVSNNLVTPGYDWDSPGRDSYITSQVDSRPPFFDVVWIIKIK